MSSRKIVRPEEYGYYGVPLLLKEKGTAFNETPFHWQEKKEYPVAANDNPHAEAAEALSVMGCNRFYSSWMYIVIAFIAVFCPWIFFAIVMHQGGVPFPHRAAKWIDDNPKDSTFIFTGISTILNTIIGTLFAHSVTSLAKEWIAHKNTDIFGLTFFTGLKNRSFPWEWKSIGHLITRHLFWVIPLYMIVFHVSTSSISALITPGPFVQHGPLQGQEIDFGATGAECAAWFLNNTMSSYCDWAPYKGGEFTTCLAENQLLDVLGSGRSNMLSLKQNTSIGVTMIQLGLQFFGPMRGVLPNGPNGIPQFNSVPLSSFNKSAGTDLTYNYTLQLQGLSSNVSCAYTPDTPIKYDNSSKAFWTYNGTCSDGQDVLNTFFTVPPVLDVTNNVFGFWACGAGDSYTVYLTGKYGYESSIGNIACSISPIQPAVFPVEYIGRTSVFSTKPRTSISAGTSSELITAVIKSLGSIIQEAQNLELNGFAESVLTVGIKSFGQPHNNQSDTYLRLFEAMIEGILEYEATYIRLLYSASPTSPPLSCLRTIDGSVDYQVIGWFVNSKSALFLIPLTIFNLTSLLMLVEAMRIGYGKKKKPSGFDPTLQDIFVFGSGKYVQLDPNVPANWPIKVERGPTVEGKGGLCLKRRHQGYLVVADDTIW